MPSLCSWCWAHCAVPGCLISRALAWSPLGGHDKVVRMLGATLEPILWTCSVLSSILQPVSVMVALAALLSKWAEWYQWHCIPSGSCSLEETWPRDPRVLGLPCEKSAHGPQACHIEHQCYSHQPSWPSLGIRDLNAYWDCHGVCPQLCSKGEVGLHYILGSKLWLDRDTNKLRVMSNKTMMKCSGAVETERLMWGGQDLLMFPLLKGELILPNTMTFQCFCSYGKLNSDGDGENWIKNEYIIAFVLPLLCIYAYLSVPGNI